MKLEGAITILCSKDRVTIEFEDRKSHTKFLEVEITPENFTAALGRLAYVDCSFVVHGLERVGKRLEKRELVFPITNWSKRKEVAVEEAKKHTPEGWIADTYYGSQNSFFTKDGQEYARTTLRRWVDE